MKRWRLAVSAAVVVAVTGPFNTTSAHPDHGGGREDFPGEGVADGIYKQHDGDEGHLPPVQRQREPRRQGRGDQPVRRRQHRPRRRRLRRYGDYAYLNAFREPTCEAGGVHVVDISEPGQPGRGHECVHPDQRRVVRRRGHPGPPDDNRFFRGDLLVHQNETCPGVHATGQRRAASRCGTSPTRRNPRPITLHTGDFTDADGRPGPAHRTRRTACRLDQRVRRADLRGLVDDEELTDVDIMDITDPYHPVMVNDTLDLVELFGVDQDPPDNLTSVFSHDMMVSRSATGT